MFITAGRIPGSVNTPIMLDLQQVTEQWLFDDLFRSFSEEERFK